MPPTIVRKINAFISRHNISDAPLPLLEGRVFPPFVSQYIWPYVQYHAIEEKNFMVTDEWRKNAKAATWLI
jgi:hypothetical protein